jgi:hypothetical protein
MKQVVAARLLASPFLQVAASERISRYYGVFTLAAARRAIAEDSRWPPARQWRRRRGAQRSTRGATPCPIGGIEVLIPAVQGVAYHA